MKKNGGLGYEYTQQEREKETRRMESYEQITGNEGWKEIRIKDNILKHTLNKNITMIVPCVLI